MKNTFIAFYKGNQIGQTAQKWTAQHPCVTAILLLVGMPAAMIVAVLCTALLTLPVFALMGLV